MLIDTHCHLNIMTKKEFDIPLESSHLADADLIIKQAAENQVTTIINVATSLIESQNCVLLAQTFSCVYATVGIHPNDCTADWRQDFEVIKELARNKEQNKIVGIGECGIDRHYPDYDMNRQNSAFKAQIELALEHNLGLVVHSRDAADETLRILDEYSQNNLRATLHCFSYDHAFAQDVINKGFVLGIGGTITYPKNQVLRDIIINTSLDHIVLETDAPFLPPQTMRGKQNHPEQIKTIAEFIANLKNVDYQEVADKTTNAARTLFNL